VSSDDPDSTKLIVNDFPRKLTFEDFDGWLKPSLNYHPENSGRWRTSDFTYGDQSQKIVRNHLKKMRCLVEKKVLPWVNSITVDSELDQIIKYGEQAWCEKRWIDDFRFYGSAKSG
jgi:hypothetical protein